MRQLTGSTRPPVLTFERVVMTDSGTLLMTWVDHTGRLELLRKRLRLTFPGGASTAHALHCPQTLTLWIQRAGATRSQAWIIHTSLFRVLTPVVFEATTRADIQRVCDDWTYKLAGTTWTPAYLWYILENEFSTIEGLRHVLPLAAA